MRSFRRYRLMLAGWSILVAASQLACPEMLADPGTGDGARNWSSGSVCGDAALMSATEGALRLVCRRGAITPAEPSNLHTIVVGFVGGYANPNDAKHPEVLFAKYLREHYPSEVQAKVFSNHDAKGALRYVKQLLDANHDRVLSDEERKNARIIIFGHSWGASETVAFARELRRLDIPVLLTIQLDIITKPGQMPIRIPPNVEKAVNFYQAEGLLRGRSEILASDPAKTEIIGNFRLTYAHKHINCNNYPWFARTFNKPHHEIENDPKVWDRVSSLIDAQISSNKPAVIHTKVATGGQPDVSRTQGSRKTVSLRIDLTR